MLAGVRYRLRPVRKLLRVGDVLPARWSQEAGLITCDNGILWKRRPRLADRRSGPGAC